MVSYGTQTIGANSYDFYAATKTNYRKTFSLVQAGVGLDFVVLKKLNLALSASYFSGINKVMQTNIKYQKTAGDTQHQATVFGKGNYWNYGITASYPISEFWQNKKD